mmetsp:Transcript_46282/g.107661  ORF Transcript_46282/g.107661 Transcript_46282/m.107661 type:complete len:211 (-) Transcript_46282:169-801(-)
MLHLWEKPHIVPFLCEGLCILLGYEIDEGIPIVCLGPEVTGYVDKVILPAKGARLFQQLEKVRMGELRWQTLHHHCRRPLWQDVIILLPSRLHSLAICCGHRVLCVGRAKVELLFRKSAYRILSELRELLVNFLVQVKPHIPGTAGAVLLERCAEGHRAFAVSKPNDVACCGDIAWSNFLRGAVVLRSRSLHVQSKGITCKGTRVTGMQK